MTDRASASSSGLDARTRFTGSIGDVSIGDLLQTLELGGKSGALVLDTELGRGTIWFRSGKICDAEIAAKTAEDAVYRIALAERGTFEVLFGPIDRPARIDASVQHLLLEGMRRRDEWVHAAPAGIVPGAVLEIHRGRAYAWEQDLSAEESTLLRAAGDGVLALDLLERTGLGNERALWALGSLARKGILTARQPPPEASSPGAGSFATRRTRTALVLDTLGILLLTAALGGLLAFDPWLASGAFLLGASLHLYADAVAGEPTPPWRRARAVWRTPFRAMRLMTGRLRPSRHSA